MGRYAKKMNIPSERKVKAMLLFDNDDNSIQFFDIYSDVVPELQNTLNSLCEFFHCLHATDMKYVKVSEALRIYGSMKLVIDI